MAPKPITLAWLAPKARENGTYLELDEIGGYEIRYQPLGTTDYSYIKLDNRTTEYSSDQLPSNALYEIAVYDMNGLYSEYVALIPL